MTQVQQLSIERAIEMARKMLSDKSMTIDEAAAEIKVSKRSLTCVRLVLEFGTPEEIEKLEKYRCGAQALWQSIKARLSPEQITGLRHRNVTKTNPPKRQEAMQVDMDLWAKLKPALHNLAQLPHPSSMMDVIRKNARRGETVAQYLEQATKWLEEFNNEWTNAQYSKSTQGHLAHARNGHAIAGTQQLKPTVE